jgi:exodeoxyribonuclease III
MNITIVSYNINSLKRFEARVGSLTNWFADQNADVVCFQETKAATKVEVPGYSSYWSFSNKKNYSGVVTYVKDAIKVTASYCDFEKCGEEGRIVGVEVGGLVLLNIYFPNPGYPKTGYQRLPYHLAFYDAFIKHCELLLRKGKSIVVVGDFNVAYTDLDTHNPHSKVAAHPASRHAMSKVMESFVDTFRYLHREERTFSCFYNTVELRKQKIGWRLDYALVTKDLLLHLQKSEIIASPVSDHDKIVLQLA